MASQGSRSIAPFVLVGLVVALLIGAVVSNFAASTPDALQRAVIDSACEGEPNGAAVEECLAEQEGEPVLDVQPASTFDYGVTWFSGLVGVILCFAVGAGMVLLLRRTGGSPDRSFSRVW